jgi:hypothetical protein
MSLLLEAHAGQPTTTQLLRKIQRLLVVVLAIALSYPITKPAIAILALDRAQAYLTYGDYPTYERLLHLALSIDNGPDEMADLGTFVALDTRSSVQDRALFNSYLATHPNVPDLWFDEALIRVHHKDLIGACNALTHTAGLNNPTVTVMAKTIGKKIGRSCT